MGTYSGLNRFRDGRFYSQLDSDGQPFDRVNALFADREGDLWAGSNEGLSRLTPERFFTYSKQQGLTHNNIMSVLEDRNGSMWVGTWGGGLDELKDEEGHRLLVHQRPDRGPGAVPVPGARWQSVGGVGF